MRPPSERPQPVSGGVAVKGAGISVSRPLSLNPPKEGVALASWSDKGVLLRFWDNGFATKNRPRKRSTQ